MVQEPNTRKLEMFENQTLISSEGEFLVKKFGFGREWSEFGSRLTAKLQIPRT